MSLRDTLERIRSSPPPSNEETSKFRILAPILAELEWDPAGKEVLWEYPVGGKKSGGKADIALTADGSIRAIVEAKAPGADLKQHIEQVLNYAFYEGVDICVLTDGLTWWLYLPREQGLPPKRRFAVLRLDKDPVVRQTPSGFYVDVNLNAQDVKKRAVRLLKALGHSESDLVYLYG